MVCDALFLFVSLLEEYKLDEKKSDMLVHPCLSRSRRCCFTLGANSCSGKLLVEGLITVRNLLINSVEMEEFDLPAHYVLPVRHWQGFDLYHAYFYFDTEGVTDADVASLVSQQTALAFWSGVSNILSESFRCADCCVSGGVVLLSCPERLRLYQGELLSLTTQPVVELAVTYLQAQKALTEAVYQRVGSRLLSPDVNLRWVDELCCTNDAIAVSSFSKPSASESRRRPASVPAPTVSRGASSSVFFTLLVL